MGTSLPLVTDLERAPDAGRTVREYARAVWRRRGLVVLLAVLGAAAGWWQGMRSPDVYAVATRVDIQKPKPFGVGAPTQAFGESYHESQLYYPTKWSLLSSGTYVERLFAASDGAGGRRFPMWDWLTWPVYLDAPPPSARETFGPEVKDVLAFEAMVGVTAREFARRYSFRRYGVHPSAGGRFDDPADLAGFLENRVAVKPEKGTTLVQIELEGEEREALAPLLNLLIEVFWREQRSETQRRLEREQKFWAKKRRELGGDDRPEDAATLGDPAGAPARHEDPLAKAQAELDAWKKLHGADAQRLELRAGARREQVLEGEARLRTLDDDLVAARPDLDALVRDVPPAPSADGDAAARAAAARRADEAYVAGLLRVEQEAEAFAKRAPGAGEKTVPPSRLEELAFVGADPAVAAAAARWRGFVDARSDLAAADARKAVVATVRDAVMRRARELRILLGKRIEVRERLQRDDADLQAQWSLTEELKRVAGRVETLTTQLAKVDAELDRIRVAISIENDARPLKVIELATDPGRPVKPNRPLLLALGAAVGLLLGLGLALVLDWLDDTVSDPEDVARHVGAPAIGHILTLGPKTADRISDLVPQSPASEAFRSVRTSLEFSSRLQGPGGRVVLVTSCGPKEGKTTVASNLALVFAQDGKRTLLVDADLRRPRVHEVMGVHRDEGLSNVIAGRVDVDAAVRPVAAETAPLSAGRLFVLPSGVLPPDPSEMLGRPESRAVFAALRARFDRIVIDTAPVGVVTDAAVLGRDADVVLLVVATGRTKKQAAEAGTSLLSAAGIRPAGVVMNLVERGNAWAYGGYYGRDGEGYYGRSSPKAGG